MKIKHIHILFIIMFFIGGGIYLSSQAGLFDTSRSVEPSRLTDAGDVYNIADIRGSFSLAEIEQYYQVPPEAIIEAFELEEDTYPDSFKLKDLKEIYEPLEIEGELYEVETDTVKVFVSLYSGIPYESEETTHLPISAVNILLKEDKFTEDEKEYWENHSFNLKRIEQDMETPALEEESQEIQKTPVIEDSEVVEKEAISITGRTTITELLSMGLDEQTFQSLTGLSIPEDRNISVRDYASSQGLEFSVIREKVESFLNTK